MKNMKIDRTLARQLWRQMLHDSATLRFFVDTYIGDGLSCIGTPENYQEAALFLRKLSVSLNDAFGDDEKEKSK